MDTSINTGGMKPPNNKDKGMDFVLLIPSIITGAIVAWFGFKLKVANDEKTALRNQVDAMDKRLTAVEIKQDGFKELVEHKFSAIKEDLDYIKTHLSK